MRGQRCGIRTDGRAARRLRGPDARGVHDAAADPGQRGVVLPSARTPCCHWSRCARRSASRSPKTCPSGEHADGTQKPSGCVEQHSAAVKIGVDHHPSDVRSRWSRVHLDRPREYRATSRTTTVNGAIITDVESNGCRLRSKCETLSRSASRGSVPCGDRDPTLQGAPHP